MPLLKRKARLAKLLGGARRYSIRFVEHLTEDGPTVFKHVCGGHCVKAGGSTLSRRAAEDMAEVDEPIVSDAQRREREETWR